MLSAWLYFVLDVIVIFAQLHVLIHLMLRLTANSNVGFVIQTAQLQIATQNVVDHPQDPACAAKLAELKQM